MFNSTNRHRVFGQHQARGYSTLANKTRGQDAFGVLNNFNNIHKISTEKRFTNPNFVNVQNPNCFAQEKYTRTIKERCTNFLENATRKDSVGGKDRARSTPIRVQHHVVETEIEIPPKMEIEVSTVRLVKENERTKHVGKTPGTNKKTGHHSMPARKRRSKKKWKGLNCTAEVMDELRLDEGYDYDVSDSEADVCNLKKMCGRRSSSRNTQWKSIDVEVIEKVVVGEEYDSEVSDDDSDLSHVEQDAVIMVRSPPANVRVRIASECDSEDSFIIFGQISDELESSCVDTSDDEEEEEEEESVASEELSSPVAPNEKKVSTVSLNHAHIHQQRFK